MSRIAQIGAVAAYGAGHTPELEDRCDHDADPARLIVHRETTGERHRLVETLPPDQARCVRLRYFEENSLDEVAFLIRPGAGHYLRRPPMRSLHG